MNHDTPYSVEVFFDGECPLCNKEITFIQKRDRNACVKFTDIAAESFLASSVGKTQEELMAEIHGRLPNGNWVVGVDVFRLLYDAAGYGVFVRVSRWPMISGLLKVGYRFFARNRLKFTGRCSESCES